MYAVFFKNRRVNKMKFSTYEGARSWARKQVRRGKLGKLTGVGIDWMDTVYSNPTLSRYGITIKAV